MPSVSQTNPFLYMLFFYHGVLSQHKNLTTAELVPEERHHCGRLVHIVFREDCRNVWNLRLEKSHTQDLIGCSVGAWNRRMLREMQRGDLVYENSVGSLRICKDSIRTVSIVCLN